MMFSPISALHLRPTTVTPLTHLIEREIGRRLSTTHRHYVCGRAVHCGDILELYRQGSWAEGRYEWTGRIGEEPTLHTDMGVFWLDQNSILRWPQPEL